MRLLDRYLLRELLIPLGFCLGGFLIFWIAFDLFSDLGQFQDNKMQVRDVAEYYLVKLPEFVVLILPVALLLALLYTLTNHARHNELTAIRAAGVSLARLSAPYLAVGLAFTAVLFVCNEYWVPDGGEKAEDIKQRHAGNAADANAANVRTNLVFINNRDGRKWQIGVYDLKRHSMIRPTVEWSPPDGSRRLLRAARGEWTGGGWTFYDVQIYTNAPGLASTTTPELQTNMLAMPELSETPEQFRRELTFYDKLSARSARSPEMSIRELLDYLSLHPHESSRNQWWLYTQLQGRLAMPWTCLVVVVIAIPFGAAGGRRNVRGGGQQHSHLFRVFCAAAARSGAGHRRLFARLAGRLDAQPDFRGHGPVAAVAGEMTAWIPAP